MELENIVIEGETYQISESQPPFFKWYPEKLDERTKDTIKTVIIPKSCQSIRAYSFAKWESLQYVIFSKDANNNVEFIEKGAFSNTKIKEIVFPPTLKLIGPFAFFGCNELESIRFDSQIIQPHFDTIQEYAFQNCTELKILEIPESLRVVSGFAFNNTKLDANTIVIPMKSCLKSISPSAFTDSGIIQFHIPSHLKRVFDKLKLDERTTPSPQ